MPLLFDRCRLGISLRNDDPPQVSSVLARHFLPRRLTFVRAETDAPIPFLRIEKNSPPQLRHLHMIEMRPAARIDAHRGSKINIVVARTIRSHVGPPLQKLGLPMLERSLQRFVAREIDVVRNAVAVIDAHRGSY